MRGCVQKCLSTMSMIGWWCSSVQNVCLSNLSFTSFLSDLSLVDWLSLLAVWLVGILMMSFGVPRELIEGVLVDSEHSIWFEIELAG